MDEKRYITHPTDVSPWVTYSFAGILFLLWSGAAAGIKTLWGVILSWIAMLVIGGAVYGVLSTYLLYGDIVLTGEGIHWERRLKTRDVPWSGIIQAVAMKYRDTPVLVLVKTGGYKLTPKCPQDWFFFRNPCKTVILPDDPSARRFVAEYYGPLDLDLSEDKSET